jgi:AmiR/NasT family two-component response regulator
LTLPPFCPYLRDVLHHEEMKRRQDTFDHEVETIRLALETRDLIGQAKGVIIASAGCTADEAFVLLKRQSQAENRKLHEIAAEIVAQTERRR